MKKIILALFLINSCASFSQRGAGIIAANKDTCFTKFIQPSKANITDGTQLCVLQYQAKMERGYGILSKEDVIYPMIGGTATAHSYNLKDASLSQITWNGGITHSSNGFGPNGSNGFGDIHWVPSLNNAYMFVASKTNNTTGVAMGALEMPGGIAYQYINEPNLSGSGRFIQGDNTTDANFVPVSTIGRFGVSRTSSTSLKSYLNGVLQTTNTTSNSSFVFSTSIYIGARHVGGGADNYSSKQLSHVSGGKGLSDAEMAIKDAIISYVDTKLGR